ncbi:UNVERIFIED_CONTAM: hypothetical protein Sindi_2951600 [Sesamum indicum]
MGLDFRSVKEFDMAMLCKQAWRLVVDTNSLLYHVLHDKYFPAPSFSLVEGKGQTSFTWWSLLWVKPLLQAGLRWRIEDESRIRIMHDPWMPHP